MYIDKYGQQVYSEQDLCEIFLTNPNKVLKNVWTDRPINFSDHLELENVPKINAYETSNLTVEEFDAQNQNKWFFLLQMQQMIFIWEIIMYMVKQLVHQ